MKLVKIVCWSNILRKFGDSELVVGSGEQDKVEKILKGSMDLIPSSLPSVKIQIGQKSSLEV